MRRLAMLPLIWFAACGDLQGGGGGGGNGGGGGKGDQPGGADLATAGGGGPSTDLAGGGGGPMDMSQGLPPGTPLSCSSPASYSQNGGGCGSERWSVKTGTDADSGNVSLVPRSTTIATLTALSRPSNLPANGRVAPTETTVWELKNVNLDVVKNESDSDYHLVVSDNAGNTMIVEVPYPGCVDPSSPFACLVTHARAAADHHASSGLVTVRGVGFFDFVHGQVGVAPNAIELHPVLGICFGQDCNPN